MPEHPPILSLSLTAYRIETPGDRVCHIKFLTIYFKTKSWSDIIALLKSEKFACFNANPV